jgi:carboxyl-terminal processing protease
MSKKLSWGAMIAIIAITAAVTVSLTYVYAMDSFNDKVADVNERQSMYAKLTEIDLKVRHDYIGVMNEASLKDGICAGYLAGLGDSQAKYLTAEKYKAYLNGSNAKNIGIGIKTVKDGDGNMLVTQVIPNSPAEKKGIKKGDTIVALDDKEIVRLTYGDALNKLDGIAGSKVKLSILRKSGAAGDSASSAGNAQAKTESLNITVTRAEYTEQTLTSAKINGNVAYIKISEFTETNASQFNTAIAARMKEKAAGIVIDLRNNSGGSISGMADMLDTLLPAGNTVSYRDKTGKTTVERTSGPNEISLPVSVIVDRNTLGAAEIFAANIKDYQKGLLVGEKTAGYGTKDEAVPLSDGSAIILSVANYLRLDGTAFNGKGIEADVNKELNTLQQTLLANNQLTYDQDSQLQAAILALVRQGAGVEQVPGASSAEKSTAAE